MVVGGWWLVVGGWWLVVGWWVVGGGWWVVGGGWSTQHVSAAVSPRRGSLDLILKPTYANPSRRSFPPHQRHRCQWPASRNLSLSAVCAGHRCDGQGVNVANKNVRASAAKHGHFFLFGCILCELMKVRNCGSRNKDGHSLPLCVPTYEKIRSNI